MTTLRMPPAPWDSLADLPRLLDAEAAAQALRESGLPLRAVTVGAVRLKPGPSALVAFTLHPEGHPDPVLGYVVLEPERAADVAAKWTHLRPIPGPLGDGVRLVLGGRGVLFLFPNDRHLRGLRFIADIDKLKRSFAEFPAFGGRGFRVRGKASRLTPVRYKPERRFIGRALLDLRNDTTGATDVAEVFLRFFADERGLAIAKTSAALRDAGLRGHLPEPLGTAVDGRLFVERAIAGRSLAEFIAAGESLDVDALFDLVGRFHRTQVTLEPGPSPENWLSTTGDALATLAHAAPDVAGLTREIGRQLVERLPRGVESGPVHGDLHLQQFLATPHGLVLVDLERTASGDPLQDLGNLAANLVIHRATRPELAGTILDRCRREAAARGRAADLAPWLAVGLVELAALPLRRVDARWPELVRERLALAREALDERPATPSRPPTTTGAERGFFALDTPNDAHGFDVFHPRPQGSWPGRLRSGDFGLYDPATDSVTTIEPARDPALGARLAILDGTLVAYRPTHRAVIRRTTAAGVRFVKLLAPSKAERLVRRVRAAEAALAAAEATGNHTLPRLARLDASGAAAGILDFAPLDGRPLHALLIENDPAVPEALAATAAALAAWHRLPTSGLDLPPPQDARTSEAWIDLVRPHDPTLARTLSARLAEVPAPSRSTADPLALVHGDLHDKNVFLDGRRVGWLDLDLLHLGDPAEDVGNLAAHLVLRALQRDSALEAGLALARDFVRHYREAFGPATDAAITAFVRTTQVRLACLYRFRRRSVPLALRLLERDTPWWDPCAV